MKRSNRPTDLDDGLCCITDKLKNPALAGAEPVSPGGV